MRLIFKDLDAIRELPLKCSLRQQASIIWLMECVLDLKPAAFAEIYHAFEGFDAYAWHASTGGARSPKIRDHLRAFGEWRELAKSCVSQRTQNWLKGNHRLYSDVTRVRENAWQDILSLFSRSTSGEDCALCFLPKNEDAPEQWSRIVVGLEWAWICGSRLDHKEAPLDLESIWASFTDATLALGGTVCLPWRGTDSRLGLSFVGLAGSINQAVARLNAGGHEFAPDDELRTMLKRGVSIAPPH